MEHIPSEILEKILDAVWHDELVAWERIDFMKSCPLVSREWRAIYNIIASRDVYIPSMQYLFYILHIIGTGRSHVHSPNNFTTKTRRLIVQTVQLYGDHTWRRTDEQLLDHLATSATSSTLLRQLDHSSFVGAHICFPTATHFVFESISTFDVEEPYTRLSVRLDGNATAAIEWRVQADSSILPSDEWSDEYRREQARIAADALVECLGRRFEDRLPSEDVVCASLRYIEQDGTLAFDYIWEPVPFSELICEDLDIYFRRATLGYYSIFLAAEWCKEVWKARLPVPLSLWLRRPFWKKYEIEPYFGRRWFREVPLAMFVHYILARRWPWFTIFCTALIFCFFSKHSFPVCVSVMTYMLIAVARSIELMVRFILFFFSLVCTFILRGISFAVRYVVVLVAQRFDM